MSMTGKRFLKALEPIVAAYWLAPPEATDEFTAIGIPDPIAAYVTARTAPLGYVTPATAAAAFYNFSPEVIAKNLRFDVAAPDVALEARSRGVRALMRRLLGETGADIAATAETLRIPATAGRSEGRPFYAANLALAWPEDPFEALWHAADLLREFRGDGHNAVLLAAGLNGPEALALNCAFSGWNRDFSYMLRGWPEQVYEEAHRSLQERGFLDDELAITDAGLKFRDMLEIETDRAAADAYAALSEQQADELLGTLEPLGQAVIDARGAYRSIVNVGGVAR